MVPRKRSKPVYDMGDRGSDAYNPCVPSPWGLEGSSPDVIAPTNLSPQHLPRIGCLERELCFKTGEAILKSHVLPKARRGQHYTGPASHFLWCSTTMYPLPRIRHRLWCGHFPSRPTAQQPPMGETGSVEEEPWPLCCGTSVWTSAPTDWWGETRGTRWGCPLHGLVPAPFQAPWR